MAIERRSVEERQRNSGLGNFSRVPKTDQRVEQVVVGRAVVQTEVKTLKNKPKTLHKWGSKPLSGDQKSVQGSFSTAWNVFVTLGLNILWEENLCRKTTHYNQTIARFRHFILYIGVKMVFGIQAMRLRPYSFISAMCGKISLSCAR